ncbi:YybS family protein [Pelotalea chapellei]|uniref:YybS family protein n=1 Tax=Pelotalea chapellei TaxID=44671 RepID=A0ABS5UC91_9BACT|nr:YybS family protein [Pelotalea chapellei]MBT1073317.1 YybS family protein [Pelotalea chapellei]
MSSTSKNSSTVVQLAVAVLGVACSFSFFAAYIVIPPAGIFSGLLAPFPALFSRFKFGMGTAVIITLGTTSILVAVFGMRAGLLYVGQCAFIALVMSELLVRKFGVVRSLIWTTLLNLVFYVIAALVFTFVTGKNIHLIAVQEINHSIAQAAGIYEKAGITGDELAAMKQSMTMAGALLIKIYPSLMTVMLIAMAGFNIALLKRFSPRWGFQLKVGEFSQFRNPEPLVWLLIFSGFALLAAYPVITVPALNVLVILSMLYFLQGLAVVTSVIARQMYSGILRAALYVMLIFQPYLAFVVAVVGIFDLWGDFRTPRKQENL